MTFWVAGAAVVGGVGGALLSGSASKSAANTQANAQADATNAQVGMNNDNINFQQRMFDQQVALQQPQRDAGNLYLNKLMHLLGQSPTVDSSSDPNFGRLTQTFDMGKFQQDPGYSFRQDEGMKGLTRGAAANGLLGSGKYLKDAMRFNQGIASDEYGKAYDRYNNDNTQLFNRYANIAGIGQTATNNLSSAAGANASNIGQIMSNSAGAVGSGIANAGAARAAGTVGMANAVNGGIGTGWNMYQQNQLMNRLAPAPSSGGSYAGYTDNAGGAGNYNFGGGY
jgi:hypothetical protein